MGRGIGLLAIGHQIRTSEHALTKPKRLLLSQNLKEQEASQHSSPPPAPSHPLQRAIR